MPTCTPDNAAPRRPSVDPRLPGAQVVAGAGRRFEEVLVRGADPGGAGVDFHKAQVHAVGSGLDDIGDSLGDGGVEVTAQAAQFGGVSGADSPAGADQLHPGGPELGQLDEFGVAEQSARRRRARQSGPCRPAGWR